MKEVYKYKIKLQLTANRLELKAIRQCSLQAFTLLELLLVIAIIAVLAGIIMFALNPAERLQEANNVKAVANSRDLEKALRTYALDNNGNVPVGLSTISQSGIYDICKYGETIGCINFDDLIASGYVGSIPIDTRNATTYTTGYKVDYNVTSKDTKIYTQEDYEREISYCPPGDTCLEPVGEWLFDEGTGLTAFDTSGNNKNGTLINGPVWIDGKYEKALSFDGEYALDDDYVSIPHSSVLDVQTNSFTISAWINRTGATSVNGDLNQPIISKGFSGTYAYTLLINNSTYPGFYLYDGGHNPGVTSTDVILSGWHNVSGVYDGTYLYLYVDGILKNTASKGSFSGVGTSGAIEIGVWPSQHSTRGHFNGLIDQVRIYNYARTPAQIAWEYNQGLPIAHWKFNEIAGTSAQDSSSNSYTGTLTNGPTWVSGKFDNALGFDGVDDYVDINQSLIQTNFSVSAWFKVANTSNYRMIVSKESPGGQPWNYRLFVAQSTGYLVGDVADGTTASAVNSGFSVADNQWHFGTFIRNTFDDKIYLYVDGILVANATDNTNGNEKNAQEVWVGRSAYAGVYPFFGQLDDVRIYNYALTQSQVMQVMQGN